MTRKALATAAPIPLLSLLCVLGLPGGSGALHADALAVAGNVTHVTLYRGQALVTRTISVDAEKGPLELLVTGLPEQIVPESLFAEGGETVEVRAVRFQSRAVGEEPREEVRKLDDAIEATQEKTEHNAKKLEILSKRSQYLDQLENWVAPTANADLSKGVLDAEALERITTLSFEQRQKIADEEVELKREAKKLQKELTLLQRKRSELTSGASRTEREAVLFLEKTADGADALRLNYLVGSCGWSPSYVFRAAGDGKEVRVEYNGLVYQMTGENWDDVALTLSTASPALSAAGPGLAPFHVALRSENEQKAQPSAQRDQVEQRLKSIQSRRNSAIVQNRQALNLTDNIGSSWNVNAAANDFQCLELVGGKEVLSSLRLGGVAADEGPSLSYALSGRVSLASRSDQQMVRILQNSFQSRFYHVATPVLSSYVYREAELKNTSTEDLLAGPMTVYLEGSFVGRGEVPTVARGQTFVVGFGADPQIRTRRELAGKSGGVQGGNRELAVDYRLVIENFKEEAAQVRLFDRLPHSNSTGDIRVTLKEGDDKLSEDKLYRRREFPKGILRWDVEVGPGATGENARLVHYGFKVEFDREFRLTSAMPSQQLQQEFETLQRARLAY